MYKIAVLIPAAGSSRRMGSGIKKQYRNCEGLPVLIKTVRAFYRIEEISQITVCIPKEDFEFSRKLLDSYNLSKVNLCVGGNTRGESVYNGLKSFTNDFDFVLIHDGARPFVSEELILRVIDALKNGAYCVVPGVMPKNTIRTKEKTLKRDELYEVQTPQGFSFEIIKQAYEKAIKENFEGTDDASISEYFGFNTQIVEGSYENIKITTKEDMPMSFRIGTGYDVHRLVENRKLMLGCIEIPYNLGLLGHSDADVLAHAIADALLGAAALGDIGKLFPDNKKETEGMSGFEILQKTSNFLKQNNFTILNVDATLIAEKPKISPYTNSMRELCAKALGINVSEMSIKATTEEGLGFTGNGSAMAAQAVCIIQNL